MPQEIVLTAFYLLILLYAVIIHEVSHGVMALWLGDRTAEYAGRLNLNPISHIDPIGSIAVPLLMFFTTGFAFGWAKPVPYNPYNLSNQKWGPTWVALAGPGSNFLLALVAAGIAKVLPLTLAIKGDIMNRFWGIVFGAGEWADRWGALAEALSGSFAAIIFGLMLMVIFWNVILGVFNLIPIPPLDGSKLLYSLFQLRAETMILFEQFGFLLLLILIFSPLYSFIVKILLAVLGVFFSVIT